MAMGTSVKAKLRARVSVDKPPAVTALITALTAI